MFLIDDTLRWSASDLTAAADCEYAFLRTLDYKLGWATPIALAADPFMEHIAGLGDRHEAKLLERMRAGGGDVIALPHVEPPYSLPTLLGAAASTREAFLAQPRVVYQAAFLDDEFFGYADFVERAADGWLVIDAKLARRAKPKALLQLGAYAEQIRKLGLSISSTVSLLLGSGERADFPLNEVLPVFRERRERLRTLIAGHRAGRAPVEWGDDTIVTCGKCAECTAAAELADDVILVAGMRVDHRKKLRAAGIATLADLAAASAAPMTIPEQTFDRLRLQASLQWRQRQAGEGAALEYVVLDCADEALGRLPAPCDGDLFFDFEGDPLYDEGDPSHSGLEYLWGVLDSTGEYLPLWAHDRLGERAAFVAFMDLVAERRAAHPDLHIYHYAPYETSALKRLAARHQIRENELDDLLRAEVFVDLYATVRGSVRIGASSYSIKKLEPLYMGDDLRSDDDDAVAEGGASVVAYHAFRELREDDPAAAEVKLAALADYNAYDCESTRRLRDWLLAWAAELGTGQRNAPLAEAETVEADRFDEQDPVFARLVERSQPVPGLGRTADQQAYAMLATALDYYRRERKQFWWEHFERLHLPVEDWPDARDIFIVESAEVVMDWTMLPGKRKPRRVLCLVGDWAPGSRSRASCFVVYDNPWPPKAKGTEGGGFAVLNSTGIDLETGDDRVVLLTEMCGDEKYDNLPVALVPGSPPSTKDIEAAIADIGAEAARAESLPMCAALDLLSRRQPRLRDFSSLPATGDAIDDVVATLVAMDDSYVAIQGPPGTGKTYSGARVIVDLVLRHHWRIGVVAQSHAVVENMLREIVEAGLDASLVGKSDNDSVDATWTVLGSQSVSARAEFLQSHRESGCVLGGTAWTFANPRLVDRSGLDLLVIDEAGQFSLAPTLGAARAAKRLLLLGDPQQLPQVTQGTHAEPVDESALGWLMNGSETISDELGFFLAETYRMHPDLCARVSTLAYDGRLESAPAASTRQLADLGPGLFVVTVDHAGNRTSSPEEAAAVVEQVRAHLGHLWTDPKDAAAPRALGEHDVLVVAPYNAQVGLIRRELDRAGFHDVRVGTVDKFQGQEAPVAIVSMTASSHGDVPRGMGFLLSRNRINVAVSRAQWRAILIRSQALTAYLPSTTDGVLELGAFIGLCEPRDERRPAQ